MAHPQVPPEHYFRRRYNHKRRWISYWHQIDELMSLAPPSILEIGPGNGLVSEWLKRTGAAVFTIDVDQKLNPHVVASASLLPFRDDAFDTVACFEVLEHLPYREFAGVIAEVHRVARRYFVLSLPDASRSVRLLVGLPRLGELKKVFPIPRLRPLRHQFDGQHHWEIGKSGLTLDRVLRDVCRPGFRLVKTYRVFEMPAHRFFVFSRGRGIRNG